MQNSTASKSILSGRQSKYIPESRVNRLSCQSGLSEVRKRMSARIRQRPSVIQITNKRKLADATPKKLRRADVSVIERIGRKTPQEAGA
jgi:hypothetical protein